MLKLFGTLYVSFSDKKDSLLQCDGFDTKFNLSQYLIVSINALIARGNDQFHTFSWYICCIFISPNYVFAKFGLDFFGYKILV